MPTDDLPEGWIHLHPARKSGRLLYVKASALISVERDPEYGHSLVRLAWSEYAHLVEETPDDIMALVVALRR